MAKAYPVHVTLRLRRGLPNLRKQRTFDRVVAPALEHAKSHLGMRIVHYCVLSTHLHLIVEADGRDALSRAAKGLTIRLARGLNRLARRRGSVFADRYHARVLRTPREVRNALCYVINNFRRHAAQQGTAFPFLRGEADPLSSGPLFDGWRRAPSNRARDGPWLTVPAGTWLLSRGWRRWGLIEVDEIPGLRSLDRPARDTTTL